MKTEKTTNGRIILSHRKRAGIMYLVHSIVLILLSLNGWAQLSTNEPPLSFTQRVGLLSEVEEKVITELPSMEEIQKEDLQDSLNGMPPRFGYRMPVEWNTENSGTWETLPDGGRMWRLVIYSPNALSINLLYDRFWLPDSAKFFLYSESRRKHVGAFTSRNNKGDKGEPGKFATELIYGDRTVLEYYQPNGVEEEPIISIAFVVHGYRYINIADELSTLDFGDSEPCNININCPEGAPCQVEKRAVALIIVDGERYCTGSLVNNTSITLEPLLLTADHCLGGPKNPVKLDAINNPDAGYWSFWWNYESPGCSNPTIEPPYITTSGATVIANYQPTDMALLRLTEDPIELPNYTPAYLGWSRATTGATSSTCIHHPRGDVKKISFSNQPAVPNPTPITWDDFSVSPAESHWIVQITSGGLAPGSSGSPLLNPDRLVVGQLHGGTNYCAPLEAYYGRFDLSWDNGDTVQRRLREWLDPGDADPMQIATRQRPSVSGPNVVCTTATYTLNSAPPGATITWTLSNSGVFSLAPSGNTVVVTKLAEGGAFLRAQVGSVIIAQTALTTETTPEIYMDIPLILVLPHFWW